MQNQLTNSYHRATPKLLFLSKSLYKPVTWLWHITVYSVNWLLNLRRISVCLSVCLFVFLPHYLSISLSLSLSLSIYIYIYIYSVLNTLTLLWKYINDIVISNAFYQFTTQLSHSLNLPQLSKKIIYLFYRSDLIRPSAKDSKNVLT